MISTDELLQHNVKHMGSKRGWGAFLKQTAKFYSPPPPQKKLVSVGSVTNYYNVS
jgi:hypothetical protein